MSIAKISASSAKNYYYEKDPITNAEGNGENLQWHGKQSEMLGLSSSATKDEFENLLNGKTPDGNSVLIDRASTITNGNEVAVFDMPLAAPKSVSLAALANDGDPELIKAHENAVKATIEVLEKEYAKTRGYVGEEGNKQRESHNTNNLLIATATHTTARPTPTDPEPNAHLHTHTLIFNQTYDKSTDSFKAIDAKSLFRDQKHINDIYNKELAKNVKELGYAIQDNGKGGWDLAGFDKEIIDKFSSRRNDIESEMQNRDNVSASDKAHISYTTKTDKSDMSAKELKDSWDRKAAEEGYSLKDLVANAKTEEQEKNFGSAKEVLEEAAKHLTQNDAHFTKKELLNAASQLSLGEYSRKDLSEELDKVKKIGQDKPEQLKLLGENSKGESIYTTKEMHDIEKDNIKMAKNMGNSGAIMSKEQAEAGIADYENKNGFQLTKGQRESAVGILSNENAAIVVQGDAGTGKSTMLAAINHALEYNNNDASVSVAAPTNKAVQGAIEASRTSSGKSFDGQTVHKFINSEDKTEQNAQKVKGIASNINEINLSTGSSAFSSNKGFSFDPSNSFSVNSLKNLEVSATSRKNTANTFEINTKSKVNLGENAGAKKEHSVKISQGGDFVSSKTDIKLANGERFQQKTESYSPLGNLGGSKSGSPLDQIGKGIAGYTNREVKNNKGSSSEKSFSLAGLTYEKKSANTNYGDQNKHTIKVLGGIAKLEHNEKNINFKNGASLNTIEKKAGAFGFSAKSVVETNYDKDGNIAGKSVTKEKSFMGLSFGKSTVVDKEGNSQTFSYTKVGNTVKDPQLISEGKIDLKDSKQVKDLENGAKITPKDKLLIIDESSMLSAKDMNALLNKAKEDNMKIVFMGDDKQLQSIGAGNAFKQMQENLTTYTMSEGQRQRNETQQDITNSAAARDIKKSVENLDKSGGLKEIKDSKERINTVVSSIVKEDKVKITSMDGKEKTVSIDYKNTAGLASTNEENKAINAGVRDKLKEQGKITNEVDTKISVNVNINGIKQSKAANYENGMKLTTFSGAKNMEKNKEYEVVGIDKVKNTLTLKATEPNKNGSDNKIISVNTKDIAGKVSITKDEDRKFGVGDKIVITQTNKKEGVMNSDSGLIVDMDQEKKIAKVDFGNNNVKDIDLNKVKGIEHGYSTTNHKAQGISVDRVVALVDTEKNGSMNSMQSYYVAMSRQKADSVLITDNKEELLKQVSKEVQNKSTLDSVKNEPDPKFSVDKASDSVKKDIINVSENTRDDGRKISQSEISDKINSAESAKNNAKITDNEDKFKEAQKESMNSKIVADGGFSEEKLKNSLNKQINNGEITKENAQQLLSNSMDNAKELKEIGILKENSLGNYSFVDSKAKEVLFDNASKTNEEIGKANLNAYKENSKAESNDKASENKTSETKVDSDKQETKNAEKQNDKNLSSIDTFLNMSKTEKEVEKIKDTNNESSNQNKDKVK